MFLTAFRLLRCRRVTGLSAGQREALTARSDVIVKTGQVGGSSTYRLGRLPRAGRLLVQVDGDEVRVGVVPWSFPRFVAHHGRGARHFP